MILNRICHPFYVVSRSQEAPHTLTLYTHTQSHIRNTNARTYRCPRYGWVVISRVVMYYIYSTFCWYVCHISGSALTHTRANIKRISLGFSCVYALHMRMYFKIYIHSYSEDENANASTSRECTRVCGIARHRSRFVAASRSSAIAILLSMRRSLQFFTCMHIAYA